MFLVYCLLEKEVPHKVFMCVQTDRAVQMLLETDSSSDQYYTDALRHVCVITSCSVAISPACVEEGHSV